MKLTISGTSLHVIESGVPSGTPVIFIHGFPFSHEMWRPQLQSLPANVRAIAYDVRGHGLSDVGDGQYTLELFVDDLMGVLDGMKIQRAVLCGLSMGGYIALRAVERHPERFAGLVLADTRSEADGNEAKVKRTASMKSVKAEGSAIFGQNFVKAVFWEGSFTRNPESVGLIKTIIAGNSPIGISGALLALASRTDTTGSLSAIRVPSLILVGEHDALTPPAAARAMHDHIVGSRLQVIPDAGHMANLENPEVFNRHLHAFLETSF